MDSAFETGTEDLQPSIFLETELTLSKKLALRVGARAEHCSLLQTPWR